MGSNSNRHFDKGLLEWGSKARKEEGRGKKRAMNEASIEDSAVDGAPVHKKTSIRRKKNTRRWCRGKEGREHVWIHIETITYAWWHRKMRRMECSGCQKKKYERVN